jgi:hypothetical protein
MSVVLFFYALSCFWGSVCDLSVERYVRLSDVDFLGCRIESIDQADFNNHLSERLNASAPLITIVEESEAPWECRYRGASRATEVNEKPPFFLQNLKKLR